jgi:hypothetical protein
MRIYQPFRKTLSIEMDVQRKILQNNVKCNETNKFFLKNVCLVDESKIDPAASQKFLYMKKELKNRTKRFQSTLPAYQ